MFFLLTFCIQVVLMSSNVFRSSTTAYELKYGGQLRSTSALSLSLPVAFISKGTKLKRMISKRI